MSSIADDMFKKFYEDKRAAYLDLFVDRCKCAVEERDQGFTEFLLDVVEHNKEMWCAIQNDRHFYERHEIIERIYIEVCKDELKKEGAKILVVQGGEDVEEYSETEDSHCSAEDSTHGSDRQGGEDSEEEPVASEESGATQTRRSPRLAGTDPENKGLMVVGMMAMLAQGK